MKRLLLLALALLVVKSAFSVSQNQFEPLVTNFYEKKVEVTGDPTSNKKLDEFLNLFHPKELNSAEEAKRVIVGYLRIRKMHGKFENHKITDLKVIERTDATAKVELVFESDVTWFKNGSPYEKDHFREGARIMYMKETGTNVWKVWRWEQTFYRQQVIWQNRL